MFSREDFPAPEGPMMAVSSPEQNLPDTPFSTILDPKQNIQQLVLTSNKTNVITNILFRYLFFIQMINQINN